MDLPGDRLASRIGLQGSAEQGQVGHLFLSSLHVATLFLKASTVLC